MYNPYLESGYFNAKEFLEQKQPFKIVVGGRGTGKTYGIISELLETHNADKKLLFLRRTQSQLEIVANRELNPFYKNMKDLSIDEHFEIKKLNKYVYGMYIDGDLFGYCAALSTFANMRGFDMSDVDAVFYDEFIPEKHERKIKSEYDALMNVYESVNRNRELQGREPLSLVMASNANTPDGEIVLNLELLDVMEGDAEVWTDNERGLFVVVMRKSPISDAKTTTALYNVNKDNAFTEMSIDNRASVDDTNLVKRCNIGGLQSCYAIGDICIFKGQGFYYVSDKISGAPKMFGTTDSERQRFRIAASHVWEKYLNRKVFYRNRKSLILFRYYFTR